MSLIGSCTQLCFGQAALALHLWLATNFGHYHEQSTFTKILLLDCQWWIASGLRAKKMYTGIH